MESEIKKPNQPFEIWTNIHFVKNHFKSGLKCLDLVFELLGPKLDN